MSGGFYQRYVPPTAKPKAKEPSPPPQSGFYTRYIPPSTTRSSPPPHKSETISRQIRDDGPAPKRRKKSPPVPTNPGTAPKSRPNTVDESEDAKHLRVKKKYQRATGNAANQQNDSMVVDDDEGEPEEQVEVVKHGLEPIPQPMDVEEKPVQLESPLPDWMKESLRVDADERLSMNSLGLSDIAAQTMTKQGFKEAFAIQSAVIPLILRGSTRHDGDICVSASTGSGKTLAYALPMIENLKDRPSRLLRGLIVVPTRDLVTQVKTTLEQCAAGSGLQVGLAVGNRTIAQEKAALMQKIQVRDEAECRRRRKLTEKELTDELMDAWDDSDYDDDDALNFNHVYKHVSTVDILICTPGRLVEHMRNTKGFTLEDVEMVVIDEADRLLDQSFQEWVDTVIPALEYMPEEPEFMKRWRMWSHARRRRPMQKIILSATMTKDISRLLSLKLANPIHVELKGKRAANGETNGERPCNKEQAIELPSTLRETAIFVKETEEKPLVLLAILDELMPSMVLEMPPVNAKERSLAVKDSSEDESETSYSSSDDTSSEDSADDTSSSSSSSSSDASSATSSPKPSPPRSSNPLHGVLIFTRTNENTARLSRLLAILRPQWADLTRSLDNTTKSSGRRILSHFRSSKISILVATDRASRGLDIKNLATVINYDVPTSLQSYVHRVGRTARAGNTGDAVTLLEVKEAGWFWDKIGGTKGFKGLRREGKISRREDLAKSIDGEQKRLYTEALAQLGAEARGGNK